MLEFAIVLPVLFILCFGLYGAGVMLTDYLKLSRISDDAIRTLSGTPDLGEGEHELVYDGMNDVESFDGVSVEPEVIEACAANMSVQCTHLLSQRRVLYLASLSGMPKSRLESVSIKTKYIPHSAAGESTVVQNTVSIKIVAKFKKFLDGFGSYDLSVSCQSPYLYAFVAGLGSGSGD